MHSPTCSNKSGVHGNGDGGGGHRVKMSLLPLKKRALNDNSSSGCYRNFDDSYSPLAKKKRLDDCILGAAERKDPAGGESHPGSVPAAAEGDAMSHAEKLRLIKVKWKATGETSSVDQPPVKKRKLMHDGIRSGARTNECFLHHMPRDEAIVLAAATGATGTITKQNGDSDAIVFDEALQRRLEQLGATRPWFVYRKRLEKSDVCPNQNRLLVSCKRDSLARSPVTRCFSPAEMRRVEDKSVGLFVTALDRGGAGYPLTCKYLDSNESYRLISDWKMFLKRNGLVLDGRGRWTRDVDVELWAFRSRALPKQPQLGPDGKLIKDTDGKPKPGLEVDEHFHPDGSLGLLLVHHEQRKERAEHEECKGKGARQPGGEKDAKQQRAKRDVAAAAPEGRADAGTSATTSEAEMVAAFGQSISLAVIGMLRLRGAMLEQSEHVEQGCTEM